MDHHDHVKLLRGGVPAMGGVWADIGPGSGAFTLALAELLGPGATIHAVDKDAHALDRLAPAMASAFPAVRLHLLRADFTQPLNLPALDGVVMANSLHFARAKEAVVTRVRGLLKPHGRLLLVEYNTDRGNTWVPWPLSFATWSRLATECGFHSTTLLARRPSHFLGEIYAAASQFEAVVP